MPFKLHLHQINGDKLAYDFEEYRGELYRMNLSCSGGGLPESGCLFFKVIGITNLTERKKNHSCSYTLRPILTYYAYVHFFNIDIAKFNCSVPGTLLNYSTECPNKESNDTNTLIEVNATNIPGSMFNINIGSPLVTALMGAGGAMIIIVPTFCVVLVCVYVKRKQITSTYHS